MSNWLNFPWILKDINEKYQIAVNQAHSPFSTELIKEHTFSIQHHLIDRLKDYKDEIKELAAIYIAEQKELSKLKIEHQKMMNKIREEEAEELKAIKLANARAGAQPYR